MIANKVKTILNRWEVEPTLFLPLMKLDTPVHCKNNLELGAEKELF